MVGGNRRCAELSMFVEYLGESRSYLQFVSLPGMGVDAVSLLVKEHLVGRHKLVVIHVGTNDLAGGVPVHALYDKLCSLNAYLDSLERKQDNLQETTYICQEEEVTFWLRRLQIMLHS